MVYNFSASHSVAQEYLRQMRDERLQGTPVLFRRNLRRMGQLMAYEISKKMIYDPVVTTTPLGTAECFTLRDPVVLATILRAGIPMHEGMLDIFDHAQNAFISAYRHHHKDGTFEVNLEYVSSPPLDGKVLVICDPMLATGSSMVKTLDALMDYGTPAEIHVACVLASTAGLEYLTLKYPQATVWIGAEDEELTAKSYIVPGLGDAGDLAFGEKTSETD